MRRHQQVGACPAWQGCLLLFSDGNWTFLNTSGNIRPTDPTKTWVSLAVNVSANGTRAAPIVAGQPGQTVAFDHFTGRNHGDNSSTNSISINSGWNVAYFDHFSMSSRDEAPAASQLSEW